ncbi:MAG: hypothetical protein DRG78_06615 [Epsilonproteobacteria bacterium]|nr:MAG: hypothetical protein DRG78_06615 [Campylobacterota bacterium]
MNIKEVKDYIQNLEDENERLKSSSDVITKVKVYEVIRNTMNNLEKVNDEVQEMRDKLYEFLDEHYDLSKFKPLHLQ